MLTFVTNFKIHGVIFIELFYNMAIQGYVMYIYNIIFKRVVYGKTEKGFLAATNPREIISIRE